eukprot:3587560-Pleurochrysis_carterae.AAC.2
MATWVRWSQRRSASDSNDGAMPGDTSSVSADGGQRPQRRVPSMHEDGRVHGATVSRVLEYVLGPGVPGSAKETDRASDVLIRILELLHVSGG